jgi:hypothetical protein
MCGYGHGSRRATAIEIAAKLHPADVTTTMSYVHHVERLQREASERIGSILRRAAESNAGDTDKGDECSFSTAFVKTEALIIPLHPDESSL